MLDHQIPGLAFRPGGLRTLNSIIIACVRRDEPFPHRSIRLGPGLP